MQSCPGLCKNRTVDVHDCTCMCARKRACIHWNTYLMCMNVHVFYYGSEYPTAEHFPCHSWNALACKNGKRVSVDQGRLTYCKDGFARGGHNCVCNYVRADTYALCSSVRVDTIEYAKPFGGHYCICNTVLWIVLHRVHTICNCMRERPLICTLMSIVYHYCLYPFQSFSKIFETKIETPKFVIFACL